MKSHVKFKVGTNYHIFFLQRLSTHKIRQSSYLCIQYAIVIKNISYPFISHPTLVKPLPIKHLPFKTGF